MCQNRNPIHCIIPIHILDAMLNSEQEEVRQAGKATMLLSARLRERRTLLSVLPAPLLSTGQKHRMIYDGKHSTALPGKLVRAEGASSVADKDVNNVYDGLGATYDLYKEVYGRNSLDNKGMQLTGTVHYSRNYDNAFWDGHQMVFGDGDKHVFVSFTSAIDVIGHELTHAVTQFTCNLDYHNQSGALNESFSDIFGTLVKQYHLKQDVTQADWLIGQGILGPHIHGVALRSMKAPGTAYDDPNLGGKDPQPDNMSGYVNLPDTDDGDNGGVHTNSGIPNKAFYLAAAKIGGYAWEKTGKIWYNTLLNLKPSSDFRDCANTSIRVAGQLYGADSAEAKAVLEAWQGVGVLDTAHNLVSAVAEVIADKTSFEDELKALSEKITELSSMTNNIIKSYK